MELPEYQSIFNMYRESKRPLFSRHFAMITIMENHLLKELENRLLSRFPSASASVLMYDGLELYLDTRLKEELQLELEKFSEEIGVKFIIKDRSK